MEVLNMATKKSKGPLLYIHQPFVRTPATNMQDVYTSSQEIEELEAEKPLEEEIKKKISLSKKDIVQEPAQKEVTKDKKSEISAAAVPSKSVKSSPSINQGKQHSSFKRVKPFKEMDIKERLDYLINYPKVLPPASCIFITDDQNYQGYLIDYTGEEITIKLFDQSSKTVAINTLKGVNLMGIKK
jgi:Spore coat protein CotO